MVVTLGLQFNVVEKPTVILYTTYTNRHAGTSNKVIVYIKQDSNNIILFHRPQRQNLYMAFNGFPDGSNLGLTAYCRGEAHRYTVHLLH